MSAATPAVVPIDSVSSAATGRLRSTFTYDPPSGTKAR